MKQILIGILLLGIVAQAMIISSMIHPLSKEGAQVADLGRSVVRAGLPNPGEKILTAVILASKQTGVPPHSIISLMYSESAFNVRAISTKGYKGLMQIPYPIYEENQNTLIGTNILVEKLRIVKGDYQKAYIIYKGWELTHPEGKRQAEKVLALTAKLREA